MRGRGKRFDSAQGHQGTQLDGTSDCLRSSRLWVRIPPCPTSAVLAEFLPMSTVRKFRGPPSLGFIIHSSVKQAMPRRDYQKQLAYQRAWYKRNRGYAQLRIRTREFQVDLIIHGVKSETGCTRCTEKDVRCLEFHHHDPAGKDFRLANASTEGVSLERLFSEMEKCEVLCANCHLKEHRIRFYDRAIFRSPARRQSTIGTPPRSPAALAE